MLIAEVFPLYRKIESNFRKCLDARSMRVCKCSMCTLMTILGSEMESGNLAKKRRKKSHV